MSTKKKEKLEQVSHKVIEKRRRDRINNCLAELSQAVPAAFAKQSSGKLEKAEILEMTVEYLRAINALGQKLDDVDFLNPMIYSELQRHYAVGYGECIREVLHYVTKVEGLNATDGRCVRMMTYLQHRLGPQMMDMSTELVSRSPLSPLKLRQHPLDGMSPIFQIPESPPSPPPPPPPPPQPPTKNTIGISSDLTPATSFFHGSRWSTHCLAFGGHQPNFNIKSSASSNLPFMTNSDDYFGLQFVSKLTPATTTMSSRPFYYHPNDIFQYN